MRTTGAKGAYRVATQRYSVTRWQKSASRSVQKKGSCRKPRGSVEWYRCANVQTVIAPHCTASIRIPKRRYLRTTYTASYPSISAAINLYVTQTAEVLRIRHSEGRLTVIRMWLCVCPCVLHCWRKRHGVSTDSPSVTAQCDVTSHLTVRVIFMSYFAQNLLQCCCSTLYTILLSLLQVLVTSDHADICRRRFVPCYTGLSSCYPHFTSSWETGLQHYYRALSYSCFDSASRSRSPFQWCSAIHHTTLDEWTAHHRGRYLHYTQNMQQANFHSFSEIRTRITTKRAAADSRLIPRSALECLLPSNWRVSFTATSCFDCKPQSSSGSHKRWNMYSWQT
jgi:hypothetical protein